MSHSAFRGMLIAVNIDYLQNWGEPRRCHPFLSGPKKQKIPFN